MLDINNGHLRDVDDRVRNRQVLLGSWRGSCTGQRFSKWHGLYSLLFCCFKEPPRPRQLAEDSVLSSDPRWSVPSGGEHGRRPQTYWQKQEAESLHSESKGKSEKANWKWCKAFNLKVSLQWHTSLNRATPLKHLLNSYTEDWGPSSQCLGLWEMFLIQTITRSWHIRIVQGEEIIKRR